MSRRATNRRDRRRTKDARSGPAERLLAVSGGLMVAAPPSSAMDRDDDAFRPSAPSDIVEETILLVAHVNYRRSKSDASLRKPSNPPAPVVGLASGSVPCVSGAAGL